MSEQTEPDLLAESLLKLEEELSSLGAVQQALNSAREKIESAHEQYKLATEKLEGTEQEIRTWAAGQKQIVTELMQRVEQTASEMSDAITQLDSASNSLVSLGKAIQDVNFPQRLDKIDFAVSSQSSQLSMMTAFQADVAKKLADLHADQQDRHTSLLAEIEQRYKGLLDDTKQKYSNLLLYSIVTIVAVIVLIFINFWLIYMWNRVA